MRSARYFFFVAGIYRQLERDDVRSSQVARLARERQDELRDVLSAKETLGVIGREAKMDLRQFPSLVYWSGLRKLEMFLANVSEGGYQDAFDDIRRQRGGFKDDDKTPQGPAEIVYWDDDLPPATFLDSRGHVKPGTTFKLKARYVSSVAAEKGISKAARAQSRGHRHMDSLAR